MKSQVPVPTIALDGFCAENKVDRINLLKLDTQGSEVNILRGASNSLSSERIDVILTEFFFVPHYDGAPLLHHIWAFLEGYGYTLFQIFPDAVGENGQARYGDALFVSPSVRRDIIDAYPDEP